MIVRTSIIRETFKVGVASVAPSVSVSGTTVASTSVKATVSAAIRVATTLLSGFFLALATPQPQLKVTATIIKEIGPGEVIPLRSNFITADGRYIMTADGQVFHVTPQ